MESQARDSGGAMSTTRYAFDPLDRTLAKTVNVGQPDQKRTDYSYLGLSDQQLDEKSAGQITKTYQYSPWGEPCIRMRTYEYG